MIVLPNWVGDVVMATPVLAAIRSQLGQARITFLMRAYVREIVDGAGWADDEIHWPSGKGLGREAAIWSLSARLRSERYDAACLLTNSFRSALVARLAGIPRRIGYARECRGPLLTERLRPLRENGEFKPAPLLPYYCALADQLGCRVSDRRLVLPVTAEQDRAGTALQQAYKLEPGRYAVINPGAAFGASKCWLPERFAAICDRLRHEFGLRPAIVGAPNEAPLMRDIASRARGPLACCVDPPTTLGSLKPLVRDAALLVCNDTGPRHYGNAFGVPTICIFGPTHQEWTDTAAPAETKLQANVPCGPCQLKTCPLDLRCMRDVTESMVFDACRAALQRAPAGGV